VYEEYKLKFVAVEHDTLKQREREIKQKTLCTIEIEEKLAVRSLVRLFQLKFAFLMLPKNCGKWEKRERSLGKIAKIPFHLHFQLVRWKVFFGILCRKY
jgi:hypothetical protein